MGRTRLLPRQSATTGGRDDDDRAEEEVHKVMHEHKKGTLKSGSGKKVRSRKQAIAIAMSGIGFNRLDQAAVDAAQRVRLFRAPHSGKVGDDPAQAHLRRVLRIVVRASAMNSPSKLACAGSCAASTALRAMREGQPSRALPEYFKKEI
jgi:hypothetical protein